MDLIKIIDEFLPVMKRMIEGEKKLICEIEKRKQEFIDSNGFKIPFSNKRIFGQKKEVYEQTIKNFDDFLEKTNVYISHYENLIKDYEEFKKKNLNN